MNKEISKKEFEEIIDKLLEDEYIDAMYVYFDIRYSWEDSWESCDCLVRKKKLHTISGDKISTLWEYDWYEGQEIVIIRGIEIYNKVCEIGNCEE